MDFFNSLSQVAKNQKNFKKWENNQKDEDAKREELAKRRQYTPAELEKAAKYGQTIIDAVDIMDNHSENVAENVETAIDPLSSLATMTAFFGGNIILAKKSTYKLYNKILSIRDNAIESEEGKLLQKKLRDYYNKSSHKYRFESILNKSDIKKVKDPELKRELLNYQSKISKETSKILKKMLRNHGLVTLGSIGVFILSTIFEAKLQTDSSKIARYQARKELEDPRTLVTYTSEQIEAAKKELKEHPELLKKEKKTKLKSGMFKSIYNIIKDRRAYLKDKSARTDNSQKVTRELTPEEIKQAEKDKDVIQRVVRVINNEAEKNSENMEVAANVIMGSTPILGATIGAGAGWILNKTGVIDRVVNKYIEKLDSEEIKELYKELKNSKKTGLAYFRQWQEFAGSLMKKTSLNKTDTNTKFKPKKNNLNELGKKLFAIGFSHKSGKTKILSAFGGIVAGFAGMILGLKLQKSAARAGRFNAKRDLEKNPENFIGYTQEEYNEVKDIKSTKKTPNKVKEYLLFIPNVLKQYYAYNKYKKHEYKEKQALREILKKQDISEEQIRDAKNLQRKIFNTFEKVDDNSQIYSESMEAATEIAQPFVWYGGLTLAASPLIVTGIQAARGKISPAKLLDKIATFFSNRSNLMQKKWFKKYLSDVEKNVSRNVNNVSLPNTYINGKSVTYRPLNALLKDIDFVNDPIINIASKLLKNSKIGSQKFKALSEEEQIDALFSAKIKIINFIKQMEITTENNKAIEKVNKFFNALIYGAENTNSNRHIPIPAAIRNDVIDIFTKPENIIHDTKRFENALDIIEAATGEKFAGTIRHFGPKVDDIKNFINSEDFAKAKEELYKLINKFIKNDDSLFPLNKKQIEIMQKVLGKDGFEKCLSENSLNSVNQFINPKATSTLAKPEDIPTLGGIEIEDAKKLLYALNDRVKTAKIKDVFNLIPEKYSNPKTVISSLKKEIEKMSDSDFEEFALDKLNMASMNKQIFLGIMTKTEKILDNIPKEELNNIWTRIIKEFQEHPDEFMQLVENKKLGSILMTPSLTKALAVAGVSWTAFSIAITYAVEAIMADLQLKAGRLGVMKAMESLDDPKFYANLEATLESNKKVDQDKDNTNLLNKVKKM